MEIKPIAFYQGPLSQKFGLPRQSGLAPSLEGRIVFEKPFDTPEAVRGLEGFDMLWLIWGFSANGPAGWEPTVRPPRLGGNVRVGVFATRSPYRPNPLGLSAVRIKEIGEGYITVTGADLMDGTPIYDIKPYVVYADSHPGVSSGFVDNAPWQELEVIVPEEIELPEGALEILRQDPRPAYHEDSDRVYGICFGDRQLRFSVEGKTLRVISFD